MTYEPEWQGYASLAESGMREAMFAAGLDCATPGPTEAEGDALAWPPQRSGDVRSIR